VKQAALALGLRVLEADRLDAVVLDTIRGLAPELLVVVAFGRIFRQPFLDLFPRGGVNVHPSLLPRYRGPSPIAAAILGGDRETGVSIQRVALEVDAGDLYAQRTVPLAGDETTRSLTPVLADVGAVLLADVLAGIEAGTARAVPQAGEVTRCRMVDKADGLVDWNEGAALIERKVRAYDPWPRVTTTWEGRPLGILHTRLPAGTVGIGPGAPPGTVIGPSPDGLLVRAGDGALAVDRLQPAFGRPMDWRAFLNGHPGIVGSRLGGPA
jgi:methionyl-tRNA formyltransferase